MSQAASKRNPSHGTRMPTSQPAEASERGATGANRASENAGGRRGSSGNRANESELIGSILKDTDDDGRAPPTRAAGRPAHHHQQQQSHHQLQNGKQKKRHTSNSGGQKGRHQGAPLAHATAASGGAGDRAAVSVDSSGGHGDAAEETASDVTAEDPRFSPDYFAYYHAQRPIDPRLPRPLFQADWAYEAFQQPPAQAVHGGRASPQDGISLASSTTDGGSGGGLDSSVSSLQSIRADSDADSGAVPLSSPAGSLPELERAASAGSTSGGGAPRNNHAHFKQGAIEQQAFQLYPSPAVSPHPHPAAVITGGALLSTAAPWHPSASPSPQQQLHDNGSGVAPHIVAASADGSLIMTAMPKSAMGDQDGGDGGGRRPLLAGQHGGMPLLRAAHPGGMMYAPASVYPGNTAYDMGFDGERVGVGPYQAGPFGTMGGLGGPAQVYSTGYSVAVDDRVHVSPLMAVMGYGGVRQPATNGLREGLVNPDYFGGSMKKRNDMMQWDADGNLLSDGDDGSYVYVPGPSGTVQRRRSGDMNGNMPMYQNRMSAGPYAGSMHPRYVGANASPRTGPFWNMGGSTVGPMYRGGAPPLDAASGMDMYGNRSDRGDYRAQSQQSNGLRGPRSRNNNNNNNGMQGGRDGSSSRSDRWRQGGQPNNMRQPAQRRSNHGQDDQRGSKGPLNLSLHTVLERGQLPELAVDQYGSRFIQQKLETASDEEKEAMCSALLPEILSLSVDVFGNYVIQRLLEHSSPAHVAAIVQTLQGNVLSLSLQMYGCRVVQKAIEVGDVTQQAVLVRELVGHVMQCVKDQNGNHVIQKCIEKVSPRLIQFIVDSFQGQVLALCTHPYGCRVIQRLLEHCSEEQRNSVLAEVLENTRDLCKNQFGNYVIQHVLVHGSPWHRSAIVASLRGSVLALAKHKFASNVVEKCFANASRADRQTLMEEVLGKDDDANSPLISMVKDQFANYVIQRMIDVVDPDLRQLVVQRIRHHVPHLRKIPYGKHIISRIERLAGPDVLMDEESAARHEALSDPIPQDLSAQFAHSLHFNMGGSGHDDGGVAAAVAEEEHEQEESAELLHPPAAAAAAAHNNDQQPYSSQ